MKKRRGALLTFLFCACVGLGVGYAALTDSFVINGEVGANIDNENLVCVFDGEETVSRDRVSTVDGTYCRWATDNAALGIDGKTTCELKIGGLTTKGNKATAMLIVENRSIDDPSLTAKLSTPNVTHSLNEELFGITVHWENDVATPTIAPGGYATLHVEVELLTTPTEAVTATDFLVTFTATTL